MTPGSTLAGRWLAACCTISAKASPGTKRRRGSCCVSWSYRKWRVWCRITAISPCRATSPVTERELVYLADKYCYGGSFVPLQRRFDLKLEAYAQDTQACEAILGRLGRAKELEETHRPRNWQDACPCGGKSPRAQLRRNAGTRRMSGMWLVRHGSLPPNPERRMVGARDIPLSDAGRDQIRAMARQFMP